MRLRLGGREGVGSEPESSEPGRSRDEGDGALLGGVGRGGRSLWGRRGRGGERRGEWEFSGREG